MFKTGIKNKINLMFLNIKAKLFDCNFFLFNPHTW